MSFFIFRSMSKLAYSTLITNPLLKFKSNIGCCGRVASWVSNVVALYYSKLKYLSKRIIMSYKNYQFFMIIGWSSSTFWGCYYPYCSLAYLLIGGGSGTINCYIWFYWVWFNNKFRRWASLRFSSSKNIIYGLSSSSSSI